MSAVLRVRPVATGAQTLGLGCIAVDQALRVATPPPTGIEGTADKADDPSDDAFPLKGFKRGWFRGTAVCRHDERPMAGQRRSCRSATEPDRPYSVFCCRSVCRPERKHLAASGHTNPGGGWCDSFGRPTPQRIDSARARPSSPACDQAPARPARTPKTTDMDDLHHGCVTAHRCACEYIL